MMAQNRAADTKIRRTPAGAPPSGTNQYTCFDGKNRTMTGRNNFAGVTYIPTASNKGAAANATAPKATAANTPIATDLNNSFNGTRSVLNNFYVPTARVPGCGILFILSCR